MLFLYLFYEEESRHNTIKEVAQSHTAEGPRFKPRHFGFRVYTLNHCKWNGSSLEATFPSTGHHPWTPAQLSGSCIAPTQQCPVGLLRQNCRPSGYATVWVRGHLGFKKAVGPLWVLWPRPLLGADYHCLLLSIFPFWPH